MVESIFINAFISLFKDLISGYLPKSSVINVKLVPPTGMLIIQEIKGNSNKTFKIKFEDIEPHLNFKGKKGDKK